MKTLIGLVYSEITNIIIDGNRILFQGKKELEEKLHNLELVTIRNIL